jgi:hypothetical protein
VVDARLHPADVVSHDEQNVGFLVLRKRWGSHQRKSDKKRSKGHYNNPSFQLHSTILSKD